MIAGRQERGRGEQFGEFGKLLDILGECAGGFTLGLDLPATGFVLLGRPPGLLADADVLADASAASRRVRV